MPSDVIGGSGERSTSSCFPTMMLFVVSFGLSVRRICGSKACTLDTWGAEHHEQCTSKELHIQPTVYRVSTYDTPTTQYCSLKSSTRLLEPLTDLINETMTDRYAIKLKSDKENSTNKKWGVPRWVIGFRDNLLDVGVSMTSLCFTLGGLLAVRCNHCCVH